MKAARAAEPHPGGTKTKILDAAEKLFGDHGFDAPSLRDITAEAQVNLAAVNYHFQSKEALIDAVIARRMEPVNRRRLEMLDAAAPAPSLEQIIQAFVSPLREAPILHSLHLIGRVFSNPDHFIQRVFRRHIGPVGRRFSEELERALPDLPAEDRFWRLQFMAGAMTHLLALWGVIPAIGEGVQHTPAVDMNQERLMARLVTFLAAGFRAPVLPGSGMAGAAATENNPPHKAFRKISRKTSRKTSRVTRKTSPNIAPNTARKTNRTTRPKTKLEGKSGKRADRASGAGKTVPMRRHP